MKRLLRFALAAAVVIVSLTVFAAPVAAGSGAEVNHDNWKHAGHDVYEFPEVTITVDWEDRGVWNAVMTPSGNWKVNIKVSYTETATYEWADGTVEFFAFDGEGKNSLLVKDGEIHLDKYCGGYQEETPYGTHWWFWKYQWVNGKLIRNLEDSGYIPK